MQSRHHGGILFGAIVLVNRHSSRSWDSLSMTDILHGYGDAVQRASIFAASDLGVGLPGLRQRQVGRERRIAFQTAIEPRDTIENRSRHFDGGDLLCQNAVSDLDRSRRQMSSDAMAKAQVDACDAGAT
jgi:hypothetical protein